MLSAGSSAVNPIFLTLVLMLSLIAHANGQQPKSAVPEPAIGDSAFDARLDDPEFKECDPGNAFQYYHFGPGIRNADDKKKIAAHYAAGLNELSFADESGYLTIRFIVNCSGQTGRFRILAIDPAYRPTTFSTGLSDRLLLLTRQLTNWIPVEYENRTYDFYQNITFKIEHGKLTDILP